MSGFVRLEGVARRWGGTVGVERLDFSVAEGEFLVLLGPSGCGKSTTLRLIAGLESPTEGRIHIDGRDVTALPPSRRGLSMVFQSYALFPHLSVRENIVFGLRVRRTGRAERERKLAEALRLTGLEGLEDRKPSALSGGQRQRVALARAVVSDSPLCLMDEPLSNLDAKLRHAVRKDIRRLQQALGLTVIYVTHDQTEAMGMADRIALLNAGRLEQIGSPEDLYERPATAFAAGFLGSPPMALMEAGRLPPALRPAEDALVGLRPESLQIGPPAPDRLAARMESFEFLGAETLVYLECAGMALTARLPGRARFRKNETVGVGWQAQDAHLFDPTTGRRIAGPMDGLREARPPAGLAALGGPHRP